jgi:hypothetical protein
MRSSIDGTSIVALAGFDCDRSALRKRSDQARHLVCGERDGVNMLIHFVGYGDSIGSRGYPGLRAPGRPILRDGTFKDK